MAASGENGAAADDVVSAGAGAAWGLLSAAHIILPSQSTSFLLISLAGGAKVTMRVSLAMSAVGTRSRLVYGAAMVGPLHRSQNATN